MKRALQFLCRQYYRARVAWLRTLGVGNALAVVLEQSVFPKQVLRLGHARIGDRCRIHRGLLLHESGRDFSRLSIGSDVFLGARTIIDLTAPVTIGDRVQIGMDVKIITHSNYGASQLSAIYPPEQAPVVVEDDAVLNWGTIVLKGTVVAKCCVVSPGSVVSGELQTNRVYCGNPARPLPQIARVASARPVG